MEVDRFDKLKCELKSNQLRDEKLYLEVYQRREKFRFFGFKEEADTEEVAREVLVGFLKTELRLENADQVEFQRVHRVGKRVSSNGKPRQVIARFLKYPQREEVMSNAGKLKGKNVGISPVKNISEAIESMENYSYQYNIKLVGFPEPRVKNLHGIPWKFLHRFPWKIFAWRIRTFPMEFHGKH